MANKKTKSKKEKKFRLGIRKISPWGLLSIILFVLLLGSILTSGFGIKNLLFGESKEEIAEKSINFINENYDLRGRTATLGSISFEEELGLYKVIVKINGEEYESYASKDGSILFPQAVALKTEEATPEEGASDGTQTKTKLTCKDISKVDKPLLEAFVVSKCPYGVQMQRILDEIVKNIPSLANNIKVEYIGSVEGGKVTAMHGEEEAQENLRQICIREEQLNKYWTYLRCHIKKGNVENCLSSAGVNKTKLGDCMDNKNQGVAYAQEDFELQNQYGATGSPTLILNGETIDESSFAAGTNLTMRSAELMKTLLCCAFKERPKDCSSKLNTNAAAISFSEKYSGSGSSSTESCE